MGIRETTERPLSCSQCSWMNCRGDGQLLCWHSGAMCRGSASQRVVGVAGQPDKYPPAWYPPAWCPLPVKLRLCPVCLRETLSSQGACSSCGADLGAVNVDIIRVAQQHAAFCLRNADLVGPWVEPEGQKAPGALVQDPLTPEEELEAQVGVQMAPLVERVAKLEGTVNGGQRSDITDLHQRIMKVEGRVVDLEHEVSVSPQALAKRLSVVEKWFQGAFGAEAVCVLQRAVVKLEDRIAEVENRGGRERAEVRQRRSDEIDSGQ